LFKQRLFITICGVGALAILAIILAILI